MSRIRSKHTQPEKRVRRILMELGWEYKTNLRELPGKPDIVVAKIKTVIFINGCFWHQHKGCVRRSMPKTNKGYWLKKLKRNIDKQREDIRTLKRLGWKVCVIWECQTSEKEKVIKQIKKYER